MAQTRLMIIIAVIASVAVAASATTHVVGGSSMGWTIPSSPSFYTQWTSSQTFTVGDTLVFNFTTGLHNVMKVPKSSYDGCSSTKQIGSTLTSGPATVTLTKPGNHYYICGVAGHCSIGQKLAISMSPSPSSTSAPASAPASAPTVVPALSPAPALAPTVVPTLSPAPASTPTVVHALSPAHAIGGPIAAVAPTPSSSSGSSSLASSPPVGGPATPPAAPTSGTGSTSTSAGPTSSTKQNPTVVAGPSAGGPKTSFAPSLSSEYLVSVAIASLLSATVAFLM